MVLRLCGICITCFWTSVPVFIEDNLSSAVVKKTSFLITKKLAIFFFSWKVYNNEKLFLLPVKTSNWPLLFNIHKWLASSKASLLIFELCGVSLHVRKESVTAS